MATADMRDVVRASRLSRLHARPTVDAQALSRDPRRLSTARDLAALEPAPELDLPDDNPA